MAATLDQIVAARRRGVASAKASADVRALERQAADHVPRGFRRNLESKAASGIAVIAELKKASPSLGLIRADFPVAELAKELEQAGAAALSVLTEEEFFAGSLADLRTASSATGLPCLRKDFIVDPFQILEARANSADAVLLIVAALSSAELQLLHHEAREFGLDVLCEVHDQRELELALYAECDIIGVNSRDLRTFQVDLNNALRLAEHIPPGKIRVAESGIHSAADIQRLVAAGFDAFLIGESLMKAERPGEALRQLLATTNARAEASRLAP
jgi:indole-3-glycerol phosphate synthase